MAVYTFKFNRLLIQQQYAIFNFYLAEPHFLRNGFVFRVEY